MKTKVREGNLRYLTITSAIAAVMLIAVALRNKPMLLVYAESSAIDFEDLSLGTQYRVGQGFWSNGVPFCVASFTGGSGTEYADGFTEISARNMAGTDSQELWTNMANLRFGFDGVISQLGLDYGAHGGNINIEINGERRFDPTRPSEIAEQEIGGVQVLAQEDERGFGHLALNGEIKSFAIGGQEFAIDNIQLEGDFHPLDLCEESAFRLLLVTQGDHTAEYNVSIVPGPARGHPNQFNQWIVTVLDRARQPLDVYGIWDPRLILEHDIEGAHSVLIRDSDAAYLFDIVFPFTDNYNGGMPAEVLLHDQELTLLADVDLSPAINRYCEEFAERTPACQTVRDEISITPISDLPEAPFAGRPSATTIEAILADSERVAACLPPDPVNDEDFEPERLRAQLQQCGLLQ